MSYRDRQNWDYYAWPELADAFRGLATTVWSGPLDPIIGREVFTVSSLVAGCRHCQSHGAHGLAKAGVELERIQALWSFEQSDLFNEAERAALRFAVAASSVPSGVTPEHHEGLRQHFDDAEVRNLFGIVALAGFLNRWNDALATVTDAEAADWATEHLAEVGWSLGKHEGAAHEQRTTAFGR